MSDLSANTHRMTGSAGRSAVAMADRRRASWQWHCGIGYRGFGDVATKPIIGWGIATPDAIHRWPPEMSL